MKIILMALCESIGAGTELPVLHGGGRYPGQPSAVLRPADQTAAAHCQYARYLDAAVGIFILIFN